MKGVKGLFSLLLLILSCLAIIVGFMKQETYLTFLGFALAIGVFSSYFTFKGEKDDDERGQLIHLKAGYWSYVLISLLIIVLLEIARRGILENPVTLLQIAFIGVIISRPLCVLIIGRLH